MEKYKTSWSFICSLCWSLRNQLCLENKNISWTGRWWLMEWKWSGWVLVLSLCLFELIPFPSLFNIWALSHVLVAFPTGDGTSQQRADPSFGILASKNLRKQGIWSIPACAKGWETLGVNVSECSVLCSRPWDLSPFIYNIKLERWKYIAKMKQFHSLFLSLPTAVVGRCSSLINQQKQAWF